MRERIVSVGRIAAGMTVAGLVAGLAEGSYRGVPGLYGAILYSGLFAALGSVVALLGLWFPGWIERRPLGACSFGWSMSLTAAALTGVLGRFILIRDLFHEAPGSGGKALALASLGAVVVLAVGIGLGRLGTRWTPARATRLAWLAPLVSASAFLFTVAFGTDDVRGPPSAVRALRGEGVVLVVADTLRADVLGVYGAGEHRGQAATPEVDDWAAKGLVFHDVSAQASWTRPAVASILTSRHPTGHATMAKNAVLPATLPTLATELAKAGVRTGAVVTNYNLEPGYGFDRGFERFEYLAPARYLGAPAEASRLALYNAYRTFRERVFAEHRAAKHFYRSGDEVNERGFAMLDAIGDGRFFLWLHYMEPHDPYFDVDGSSYARVSTPKPDVAAAAPMQRAYRDDVRRFDTAFGALLRGLEARGLAERVTVVLVSDHGEEFADHGGFWHGTTLYEEQLRVPLVVRGPGVAAGHDTTLARQIDVAPTILARLGAALPPTFEGRDLLGPSEPPPMALAEEDHEGNRLASIREAAAVGGAKLITANPENPRGLGAEELYDLVTDPGERRPLAAPADRTRMSAALAATRARSAQGGAATATRQTDATQEAELRALGYVQ